MTKSTGVAKSTGLTKGTGLAVALLDALRQVPGLQPARPATVPTGLRWDAGLLAVDVEAGQVTMRLVASRLPLPPLLGQAAEVLRATLTEHGHGDLRLRLEVTDLDRAAFGAAPRAGPKAARPARRRRAARGTPAARAGQQPTGAESVAGPGGDLTAGPEHLDG